MSVAHSQEGSISFDQRGLARNATSPVTLAESAISPVILGKYMTGRIGAKGQVVIPKALRDLARLQPGDEVEFELRDDEIVLVARRSPVPVWR